MTSKLDSVIDRSAHQRSKFIFSLAPLLLGDHPKAVAGRVISILAVLGFLSFASPAFASVSVWSYAGVNYPNQAAAVAAMRAANPAVTQMSGVTRMGFGTVTYQYIIPRPDRVGIFRIRRCGYFICERREVGLVLQSIAPLILVIGCT